MLDLPGRRVGWDGAVFEFIDELSAGDFSFDSDLFTDWNMLFGLNDDLR